MHRVAQYGNVREYVDGDQHWMRCGKRWEKIDDTELSRRITSLLLLSQEHLDPGIEPTWYDSTHLALRVGSNIFVICFDSVVCFRRALKVAREHLTYLTSGT
jgi:hypothetical protein